MCHLKGLSLIYPMDDKYIIYIYICSSISRLGSSGATKHLLLRLFGLIITVRLVAFIKNLTRFCWPHQRKNASNIFSGHLISERKLVNTFLWMGSTNDGDTNKTMETGWIDCMHTKRKKNDYWQACTGKGAGLTWLHWRDNLSLQDELIFIPAVAASSRANIIYPAAACTGRKCNHTSSCYALNQCNTNTQRNTLFKNQK